MDERWALEETSSGVILPVKAFPGAKKNEIREVKQGMLKVCCTQIPEKGKANKAILEILAKSLKLKRSQLSLLSGETDSHKKFLAKGISQEEIQEKWKMLQSR